MRAHFIDVGQGDATLLEMSCAAVLIDTGGELNESFDGVAALRDYLDAFFARRPDLDGTIELMVITHPHIDHTRGIPMVLSRYKVRHVIDNGQERSSGKAEAIALHEWVRAHPEVAYEDIHADRAVPTGLTDATIDPIRCPDVDPEVHVLWGAMDQDPGWHADRYGKKPFENENNHSVVLRVDFGRASFLFPGDLEEVAIGDMVKAYAGTRLLDVDVYKVGHHGSRNATPRSLFRLWNEEATDPTRPICAMMSTLGGVHGESEATRVPRMTLVEALIGRMQVFGRTDQLDGVPFAGVEAPTSGKVPFSFIAP